MNNMTALEDSIDELDRETYNSLQESLAEVEDEIMDL